MKKTVTVITDDPSNKKIPVTIQGKVIALYTLTPKSVSLKGTVGEALGLKKTVHLVPSEDYPFKIQEITAKRGKAIRFSLKEIKKGDTPEYEITVENTATEPGTYFDTLFLKTDSEKKSEIEIGITIKIREETEESPRKKEG